MHRRGFQKWLIAFSALIVCAVLIAGAATIPGSLTFTNTPLLRPDGNSEPAISIDANGKMAVSGLSWINFGTNLWTGTAGSAPAYQVVIDSALQKPGKRIFGGGDADVDLGSTGTLHATTLIFLVNPPFRNFQLGVSAITCPNATTSFDFSQCKSQIIDSAGDDRQWMSSDGSRV